jgi:hypothetical protein
LPAAFRPSERRVPDGTASNSTGRFNAANTPAEELSPFSLTTSFALLNIEKLILEENTSVETFGRRFTE